ncbi:hypothetical protein FGO68_gene259 [Halteria grandinella]|uniref:Uncharacterized protein n=1 Tax=Halteria grandinella TaxID=5974 RepID=A0A8J8T2F3_HALGN|nr:hypothetical protein FGO68_gene259 [Halteria grandinella]
MKQALYSFQGKERSAPGSQFDQHNLASCKDSFMNPFNHSLCACYLYLLVDLSVYNFSHAYIEIIGCCEYIMNRLKSDVIILLNNMQFADQA